jgi:type IV secretory pathway VirJ component
MQDILASIKRFKRGAILLLVFTASVAFAKDQKEIGDLPVTEYKSGIANSFFVIYLSGDGGMNEFSKAFCENLQNRGYSVVALDCKKHFWKAKTPEVLADDINRILVHYENLWQLHSFFLVGYSFGADVAAFIPQRLSDHQESGLLFTVLLDPALTSQFEIKLVDMLGKNSRERKYSTINEINTDQNKPLLCIVSADDEGGIIDRITNKQIKVAQLPGDHRFNNDYNLVVNTILKML